MSIHRSHSYSALLLAAVITTGSGLLSGCTQDSAPETAPTQPRPVKTLLIETPENELIRQFPGRVTAATRATLSFQVNGKLKELPVSEGADVSEGQVLAKLDDKDLRIALRERDANFKKAAADFKRGKDLVGKGHISRRDFDTMEANLATARAALDQARNQLSHATLKAPFAGSVTRRLVNDFEQITAKQPILELNDLNTLEIKFDVPETLVQRIQKRTPEAAREITKGRVFASFESLPGKQFELTFKEAAGEADADTQTFEVSFTMPTPKRLHILPGMSATVTGHMDGIIDVETPKIQVPAKAVAADANLQPFVWIVTDQRILQKRPVKVGEMRASDIEVLDGLAAGDRVVVAGVASMVEGLEVRLMQTSEQAEPRRQ